MQRTSSPAGCSHLLTSDALNTRLQHTSAGCLEFTPGGFYDICQHHLRLTLILLCASAVVLHRFYLENITQLKDIVTVELFFLNAKSAVYNVSTAPSFLWGFEAMKDDSVLLNSFQMIHCLLTPRSIFSQQPPAAGETVLTRLAGA